MPSLPLSTSVRSLNRLRLIARVLGRHGFGHVVERMNLGRYLPFGKLFGRGDEERAATTTMPVGRRLALVCSELGPVFVKLGQMISSRPDLVAPEILAELRQLQDQVPPFDGQLARSIVAEEIGGPLTERFAFFDTQPFASGSIGQVHHARTADGQEVVVKVKRPGIEDTVRLDMQLLKWLAAATETWLPELARYKPVQIVEEFEILLTAEMDYVREAAATSRFAEAFARESWVAIPHVHWDLTGRRVLTLSRMRGANIEQLLAGDGQGVDRPLLARRMVLLYLRQFFDLRQFHADPHPGNFLITPPARIGLVDFGQVGTLSDELAGQLVVAIVALIYREPQVVVDVLADLGAINAETDTRALNRALRQLVDKYYGLPLKRLDLTTVFYEVTEVIRAHNVTLPRDLVMVLKTLITISGVALRLDPEMDLVAIMGPKIRGLVTDRFSPARLTRSAGVALWHTLSILKTAPQQLRAVLRQISGGRWQVNIRHENLDRLIAEIDRSSNRMAFSIVIAAVIVGSSVVVSAGADAQLLGIPIQWIGALGYVVAGLLGIGLVWAIIRSGRLS